MTATDDPRWCRAARGRAVVLHYLPRGSEHVAACGALTAGLRSENPGALACARCAAEAARDAARDELRARQQPLRVLVSAPRKPEGPLIRQWRAIRRRRGLLLCAALLLPSAAAADETGLGFFAGYRPPVLLAPFLRAADAVSAWWKANRHRAYPRGRHAYRPQPPR